MLNQVISAGRDVDTTPLDLSLLIRFATPQDRPVIIKNINSVCAEQVYLHSDRFVPTPVWEAGLNNKIIDAPPHLLAVAEVDGRVIGHGRLFPGGYGHKDRHVVDVGIALLKPFRELRIGTKLLECMVTWANLVGYEKLTATVISTNRRALNLFTGLGFVKEGIRVQQFKIQNQYVDEILLGKFLNNGPFK